MQLHHRFSPIQSEWHATGHSPGGALHNAMIALSNRDKPNRVYVHPLWILAWWWSQYPSPGQTHSPRGGVLLWPRETVGLFEARFTFPNDSVTQVARPDFTIHFDRWEMVKMAARQIRSWSRWVVGSLRRRQRLSDGPNQFTAPLRQNVGIGSIRGSVFPWEPQGTTTADRMARFDVPE